MSESATTDAPRSVAQLLYTDGLHSIFQFLSLRDLVPAIVSCRSWRDAAYKEKSRGVSSTIHASSVSSLCGSPLARHVCSLSVSTPASIAELPLLAQLPELTELRLTLSATAPAISARDQTDRHQCAIEALARCWPARLQRLRLLESLPGHEESDPGPSAQVLIDVAACLPTLTDLSIETSGPGPEAASSPSILDWTPLQRLTQLARLSWSRSGAGTGTPNPNPIEREQIEQIKQIDTLQYLELIHGNWSVWQLQWLCDPPHRLQRLQELNLRQTDLTPLHVLALAHLPALTRLASREFDPSALPLLSRDRFPHLRSLKLHFRDHFNVSLLLTPLRSIGAQLAEVDFLIWSSMSEEQSTALFALLPSVQSLALSFVRLPSLLALRRSLRQLVKLTLVQCSTLKPDHFLALQHVASLRELSVRFAYDQKAEQMPLVREICRAATMRHFTLSL